MGFLSGIVRYERFPAPGAEARDAAPALLAALGDEGRLDVCYYARSVGLASYRDNIQTLWMGDVAAEALARVAPDGSYTSQAGFLAYKARRTARLADAEQKDQAAKERQRVDEEAYQATCTEALKAALKKVQSDEDRARAIERYRDWPPRQDALSSLGRPLGESERLAAGLLFDVACRGGDAGKKATEFLRTWARLGRFTELDIEGEFREDYNPASPPEPDRSRDPRLVKDLKDTLRRAVKDHRQVR